MLHGYEMLGLGSLGALAMGCWQKIKDLLLKLVGIFIHRVELAMEEDIVFGFAWNHFQKLPLSKRYYTARRQFVRPVGRYQQVASEWFTRNESMIFFYRGWPLFITNVLPKREDQFNPYTAILCFRGTINLEQLVIDMVDDYNRRKFSNEQTRFVIGRMHGQGALKLRMNNLLGLRAPPTAPSPGAEPTKGLATREDDRSGDGEFKDACRVLKWTRADLGPAVFAYRSATELLAFPPKVTAIIDEVTKWKNSELWHREKSIPWRRGLLLYGLPGTGKSSLVRAIASDLDLPLYVVDLASMSNDELLDRWAALRGVTPCICLIEDIDSIFHGRENILGDEGGGLTFDCLLNCLSGVEGADGIFVVVTTNHVQHIDEALGTCREGSTISTRPGRLDRAVELGLLDEACRRALAQRILADCPELIEAAVQASDGYTGAQCQFEFGQIASREYWKHKNDATRSRIISRPNAAIEVRAFNIPPDIQKAISQNLGAEGDDYAKLRIARQRELAAACSQPSLRRPQVKEAS